VLQEQERCRVSVVEQRFHQRGGACKRWWPQWNRGRAFGRRRRFMLRGWKVGRLPSGCASAGSALWSRRARMATMLPSNAVSGRSSHTGWSAHAASGELPASSRGVCPSSSGTCQLGSAPTSSKIYAQQ
jgi:hypothetical protein